MKLIIDGITLKEVIKNMKDIVNEVDMLIDKEGVSIITMDPANVAMVIFKLPAKSCIEFEHTENETGFGLNLTNLSKILKRTTKGDLLTLETTDAKMSIKLNSNRAFTIPKIDIEENKQEIPKITYLSHTLLDRKDLLGAVEDVNLVSDAVMFTLTKDNLTLSGEGGLMSAKTRITNVDTEYKDEKENLKSKYSIEYISKMLTAPSDKVKVELNNESPVRLTFKNELYDLMYLLAPQVSDDDE